MDTQDLINRRLIYLNHLLANSLQQGDIPEVERLQLEIQEYTQKLIDLQTPIEEESTENLSNEIL
jgi:hypothetical protein